MFTIGLGIAILNLPFWDGLHHLSMVFSGVVYYCYTLGVLTPGHMSCEPLGGRMIHFRILLAQLL